jgi:hypothetical protein
MNPQLDYYLVSGSRWTFEDKPVTDWLQSFLDGTVLNPFAGETQLPYPEEIRNDIDESRPAEYHMDAMEFIQTFGDRSAGTVVHDPPWSDYQSEDKYAGYNPENVAALKREYNRVLKPGGYVVQFGYTTTCMPGELEYERPNVAVFQPYGPRKAFLGTADRKRQRLV